MTAVTARAAGVERVIVASPRPAPTTLAAAAIAGADAFLAVGGAQAIAALAHGTETVRRVDFVCGPGNRWVTAAKQVVFGTVGIDSLAGPSELLVVADETSDPRTVAADLLAQAEHDVDALPVLIATSERVASSVDAELDAQLDALGESCARESLRNGFATVARDQDQIVELCDALAPEHLAVMTERPEELGRRLRQCGALFLGAAAGEVLGDYGAGPNHVLPTGRGARARGGLSALDFVRVRTWLEMDSGPEAEQVTRDAVRLAELEGLTAHARSAACRLAPAAGNAGGHRRS